jgi:hypothetical protein
MVKLAMAISQTEAAGGGSGRRARRVAAQRHVRRRPRAVTPARGRCVVRMRGPHPPPARLPARQSNPMHPRSGQPAAPAPAPAAAPDPAKPAAPPGQQPEGRGLNSMGSMLRALRSTLSTAAAAAATAAAAGLPTCAGCGRPAGGDGSPVLQAQGKNYHSSCFVCAGCHKPLVDATGGGGGFQFNLGEDGQAYHPACHKELFHPRCSVCADFIPQAADGRVEWNEHPFWKARGRLGGGEYWRLAGAGVCGSPRCTMGRARRRGVGWRRTRGRRGGRALAASAAPARSHLGPPFIPTGPEVLPRPHQRRHALVLRLRPHGAPRRGLGGAQGRRRRPAAVPRVPRHRGAGLEGRAAPLWRGGFGEGGVDGVGGGVGGGASRAAARGAAGRARRASQPLGRRHALASECVSVAPPPPSAA